MRLGFIKSIAFFFLIESIFIITGGGAEWFLTKYVTLIKEETLASALGFPFAALIICLLVFWLFPSVYKQCITWLTLSKKNILTFFLAYLITGFLFIFIVFLAKMSGLISPPPFIHKFFSIKIIAIQFVITILVGFTEEFIYRGVISSYFLNKTNKLFTIIFVSLLFSIGHLNYSGLLPFITAFTMGVVSVLLLFKTESLYASIGLHCGWNFIYIICENSYNLDVIVYPFWGDFFELYQIGLLCIIIIALLLYKRSKK